MPLAQICLCAKHFRHKPESDQESCSERHGKPQLPSDSGKGRNLKNPLSRLGNCGHRQSTTSKLAESNSGLLPGNILDALPLALQHLLDEANVENLHKWM